MKITDMPGQPGLCDTRKGDSFADTIRKEGPDAPVQQMSMARAFGAGDLATGFAWLRPDFMPTVGAGMIDAVALGEGAVEEMRRYEEKTRRS